MEILSLLWGTVLLRPYVFVFFALYLIIAVLHMGWVRSLLFTALAYSISFFSEYSSTRNGFPYGSYSYIEATRGQELWIFNLPFMDSLSFTFLAYVSYTFSLLIWSPLVKNGLDVRWAKSSADGRSLKIVFTGALLFMLMDVIIDPVAFRGDRWFLGPIYTYQEAGEYFNIPLTNFAGWFLVGAAILFCFTRLNGRVNQLIASGGRETPAQALLGPALYFGVLAFNLFMTFYIGEIALGYYGSLLFLSLVGVLMWKIRFPDRWRV